MKPTRHPLFIPSTPGVVERFPADATTIAKLESSFALFARPGSGFAERVYERIFGMCPHLRALFPDDMNAQNLKLVATLQAVIDHLHNPQTIRKRLLELGRAHVAYGAKREHYPVVIGAIVGAMSDTAGAAWSAELTSEWTRAMNMVGEIMLEGSGQTS